MSYKVMIVDDEEIIVTGLSRLLPLESNRCRLAGTAGDGREALAKIRELRPDILFTDIYMPEMNGLELIAALRSEFPQMQITILSGYPEFEYARKAMRLGVTHYLLKPSKMNELEEALAEMVRILDTREGAAQPSERSEEPSSPPDESADAAGNFILANAIRYIEEHYAEKLTLPLVADHVYVSQWHLSKLIARGGHSFSDLLNRVRIGEAKKLLENPALRIWEISERIGFSDVTHFSRIFKKLEGKSANEYRNQTAAKHDSDGFDTN